MLTPFHELLDERRAGSAVGAFTAYDLEEAVATLAAARAADTGVILLVGSKSFAAQDGSLLLDALIAAVSRASGVRACVQLDHCTDLELLEAALAAGAGAVMADGSALALRGQHHVRPPSRRPRSPTRGGRRGGAGSDHRR